MVSRASDERNESRAGIWNDSHKTLAPSGSELEAQPQGRRHGSSADLGAGRPHANPDQLEIESNGAGVYYAYILRCADGSFYVGSAQDLDSRVKAHNDGHGATYTFKHRPVQLVYSEAFESETAAVSRERQLKRWSHEKKAALIAGNLERLKRLSKHRS